MDTAQVYVQQLSETDLRLLAPAAGLDPNADDTPSRFHRDPSLIEPALVADEVYEAVFDPQDVADELLVHASPFLVFAVAVHRGTIDLHRTTFTNERIGRRQSVPVFGTDGLRAFTVEPAHRLFLVEHLTSYTKVRSGPIFVQRGNRMRRHRFSEIDAPKLAGLLDMVPEEDRPGIYRRLGDLALFLTGVFPDNTTREPPHPIEIERLLRSVGELPDVARLTDTDIGQLVGTRGRAGLLEWLGPRWYRLAASSTPLPSMASLLAEVADGFDEARRFLTLITDRYLFGPSRWFGPTV